MIKLIAIGLFAFATWFIPWFYDSWGLFVLMTSLLSLFLLSALSQFYRHYERVLIETFILASLLMSIKCVLGTPFEIDGMSHLGIAAIIIFGIWHFDKYRKTLKR